MYKDRKLPTLVGHMESVLTAAVSDAIIVKLSSTFAAKMMSFPRSIRPDFENLTQASQWILYHLTSWSSPQSSDKDGEKLSEERPPAWPYGFGPLLTLQLSIN